MARLWKRFLALLFFWRHGPKFEAPPLPKVRGRGADIEETGRWYFRRDILDRLPQYFEVLKTLRRVNPWMYTGIGRIGAVIASANGMFSQHELPPSFRTKEKRLGVGFVALHGTFDTKEAMAADDGVPAAFATFERYDTPPPFVQPFDGDVYLVACYWFDKGQFKADTLYFAGVDADANVKALKFQYTGQKTITPRHGKPFTITAKQWSYGEYVEQVLVRINTKLARANKRERLAENMAHRKRKTRITPDELVRNIFAFLVNVYESASCDVRIAVMKDGLTAAFSVDLLRMPYFFSDRDAELAVDGKKKRIFHIVRTHERNLKSGKKIYVKSHFRGARKFVWNGYRVNITMPGYHHADLLRFDAGAHYLEQTREMYSKTVWQQTGFRKIAQNLWNS